jgi:hypothetical protein
MIFDRMQAIGELLQEVAHAKIPVAGNDWNFLRGSRLSFVKADHVVAIVLNRA